MSDIVKLGTREETGRRAIGAPHMPLAVGPVILIDIHATQLTPAAMTNLTPEIGLPPHAGYHGAKFGF